MNARVPRSRLEPVRFCSSENRRVFLGNKHPFPVARIRIERDDLLVHASRQEQVVLRPPVEETDGTIRPQGPEYYPLR